MPCSAGSEMPTDYNPPQFLSNEIWCNRVFLQVWDRLIASIIEHDFFEHAEIIRCDRYRAKRNSANRNKGLRAALAVRTLCHTLRSFLNGVSRLVTIYCFAAFAKGNRFQGGVHAVC